MPPEDPPEPPAHPPGTPTKKKKKRNERNNILIQTNNSEIAEQINFNPWHLIGTTSESRCRELSMIYHLTNRHEERWQYRFNLRAKHLQWDQSRLKTIVRRSDPFIWQWKIQKFSLPHCKLYFRWFLYAKGEVLSSNEFFDSQCFRPKPSTFDTSL